MIEPRKTSASDIHAISKVERLPLANEDDESAAIKVTHGDGRFDVWLVRLTPPIDSQIGTPEHHPDLPLAQPVLEPVITADSTYRLDGHLGFVGQGGNLEVQVTVGSVTGRHINEVDPSVPGTADTTSSGVWEGYISDVVREGTTAFFVVETSSLSRSLTAGESLQGEWLSLSMGFTHPNVTVGRTDLWQTGQSDIMMMFQM